MKLGKRSVFIFCVLFSLAFRLEAQSPSAMELDTRHAELTFFGDDAASISGVRAGSYLLQLYLFRDGDYWLVTRVETEGESPDTIDPENTVIEHGAGDEYLLMDLNIDGIFYFGTFAPQRAARADTTGRIDRDAEPDGSLESGAVLLPVRVVGTEVAPEDDRPAANGETLQPIHAAPNLRDLRDLQDLQELVRVLEGRVLTIEERGISALQTLNELQKQESVRTELGDLSERISFLAGLLAELREAPSETVHKIENDDGLLSIETARSTFGTIVRNGFSGGTESLGTWSFDENAVDQVDPDVFFAKLRFPLEQHTDEPVLYAVTVMTPDPGWVGAGVHLFASAVDHPAGYGHGVSLLVWLTRDVDVYGSDKTYLQIYRSTNDVEMERIAHAALPERIEAGARLEVLLDPQTNYITVAVNGEERFRYFVFFPLSDGVEVSLRSLGRARFEELQIRGPVE